MGMAQKSLKWGRWLVVLIVLAFVVTALPKNTEAQGGGQTHVVAEGENLFRIALRYGTSVDAVAAANGITDPTRIYVGQTLTIPDGSAPATTTSVDEGVTTTETTTEPVAEVPAEPADAPIYHIVQSGQTLASIGRQYGVTWAQLSEWNNIVDANTIYAGQRLVVNTSAAPAAAVAGPTITEAQPAQTTTTAETTTPAEVPVSGTHTVQAGERLASIARIYGISWTSIAAVNNITNPNTIYVGQVLQIPSADVSPGTYLAPTYGVPSAPAPTASTGKEIIVKLNEQRVYAYENGQLLRAVTVSTGLPGTPTVTGNYRVYWKLSSQTMSGPGYYLPGVPYVMYFYQDYALHGTYWHSNFGQPMSHGCVNLPTPDAQWLFSWAEIGTPVNVSY